MLQTLALLLIVLWLLGMVTSTLMGATLFHGTKVRAASLAKRA